MESQVDIAKLIHRGGIFRNVEGSTPQEIYAKVCKMIDLPEGMSSEQIYKALCAREEILSTAVGNGIALPHARTPIMTSPEDQRICIVYLKNPIDMNAPDEREVSVMFILLTYNSQVHLKILSQLAELFRNSRFRRALGEKADEVVISSLIKELA